MIDKDGNITIKFYHGTSSIFLPLIKEYGLGGFNILEEFNLEELLRQLCHFLEVNKEKSEWWQFNDFMCAAMLNNKVTNGNMNFRYGGVYITPSKFTATNYAKLNKYGSEYLTTVVRAWDAVKEVSESVAEKIIPTHHVLNELINSNPEPLLITIANINKKLLSTELGNDLEEQLEFIKNSNEVLWQQSNFTVNKIISSSELSFEKLYSN